MYRTAQYSTRTYVPRDTRRQGIQHALLSIIGEMGHVRLLPTGVTSPGAKDITDVIYIAVRPNRRPRVISAAVRQALGDDNPALRLVVIMARFLFRHSAVQEQMQLALSKQLLSLVVKRAMFGRLSAPCLLGKKHLVIFFSPPETGVDGQVGSLLDLGTTTTGTSARWDRFCGLSELITLVDQTCKRAP